MASVFVTGSSDGLGRAAAALLVAQGHRVTLHARDEARGREALVGVPGAGGVLCADLASMAQTKRLAGEANALGDFDAVIHNAAVGYREKRRILTEDGLSHVFAVNTLAPFILTALMRRPRRLVFVSSELHRRGSPDCDDLNWERRVWKGNQAYSDTKLHDAMLAFAVARRWPDVRTNALEPGWVATKMGGPRASGDLSQGHLTQVWLATDEGSSAEVSGGYFFHRRAKPASGAARAVARQEALIAACESISGVALPA